MTVTGLCFLGLVGCMLALIGVFADWFDDLYERETA